MKSVTIKSLLFLLFVLLAYQLYSQKGTLYLTNYQNERANEFQNWSVTQDKHNNILFANRKGIMIYNGEEWNLVRTPSMPFILFKEPSTQRIFVGLSGDYGYLSKDNRGFYNYTSLGKDTITPGEFTQIEYVDSVIYFMSEKYFARFEPVNLQHKKYWYAKEDNPFTGIVHNKDHVFINVWNKGLHRLQSDTLFPIVSGFYTENNEILFNLPYNEERILIGTDDNKLRLFDGMKYYDYSLKGDSYLSESIVSGAINLSDTSFALSTLAGGVVVIDKKDNEILHTINYQTGLPDDEVFTLGIDNNNGLWITHDKGISRADLSLPVRNFSTYPGIEGNINNVVEKDSIIYVATGEGLFYLTEEKEFEEKKVTVKVSQPIQPQKEEKQKEEAKEEDKKPKKFVKKFFNKIFKSEEEKEEEEQEEEVSRDAPARTKVSYRTKRIYSLQSVSHKFKKVEGLEGKSEHLMLFDDVIIVGTNYGIYEVNKENKAEPIHEGSYIYEIIPYIKDESLLFATRNGILEASFDNKEWNVKKISEQINDPVYSLAFDNQKNILWAGSDNKAFKIEINPEKKYNPVNNYSISKGISERYFTRIINQDTYLFTPSGIFLYDENTDSFSKDKSSMQDSTMFGDFEYIFNQADVSWVKSMGQWKMIDNKTYWNDSFEGYLKLFTHIENIYLSDSSKLYVIDQNTLYRVDIDKGIPEEKGFNVFYTQIKKNQNNILIIDDFNLEKENVSIQFNLAATHFVKENATQYQYYIEGLMDDWSNWSDDHNIEIFSHKGDYTIKARARNIWGQVSETEEIRFEVPPPFTETAVFYIIIALGIIVLGYFVIKLRERKLKHDKMVLEQKVKERTKTIEEQKEEIETQRDEILQSKNELQKKNEEITDSIEYASRIQTALLPLQEHFHKAFQDHFILFKPRDIVSGDFYWIYRKNQKIYVTAADCTGHGVPGAFMSMLGISFLNEIVSHDRNGVYNAADILNNLRNMVKQSLRQSSDSEGSKDGMDMSLCIIDKKKNVVDFAGAFNPMILFRNGEMEVIKADRMPVGVYVKEKGSFTNQQVEVKAGDTFYIFSDGYIDQFGGPKGKKFKMKALKNLLNDIYDRNMEEQLRILDHNFKEWKGDNMQVDDVIVLGIKI